MEFMVRIARSVSCVLVISISACTSGRPALTGDTALASSSAGSGSPKCPDWGCDTNDATVDADLFFHDLSVCGQRNTAGLNLVGFVGPQGQQLSLAVIGDELVGVDPRRLTPSSTGQLRGQELVGTKLILASARPTPTNPDTSLEIEIAAVGATTYWVGEPGSVPTYVLKWRGDHNKELQSLCGRPRAAVPGGKPWVLLPGDWTDKVGTDATIALVFAGDAYEGNGKSIKDVTEPLTRWSTPAHDGSPGPQTKRGVCWFNVACAGSAISKMHLLRHTTAGSDASHQTDKGQRTTMLKMITDDVCGTGKSFTVNGEKVFYEDMQLWHPFPAAPRSIESLWTRDGAMCLGEARREREDPSVTARIHEECARANHPLPPCPITASNYRKWPGLAVSGHYGYGLSANPP